MTSHRVLGGLGLFALIACGGSGSDNDPFSAGNPDGGGAVGGSASGATGGTITDGGNTSSTAGAAGVPGGGQVSLGGNASSDGGSSPMGGDTGLGGAGPSVGGSDESTGGSATSGSGGTDPEEGGTTGVGGEPVGGGPVGEGGAVGEGGTSTEGGTTGEGGAVGEGGTVGEGGAAGEGTLVPIDLPDQNQDCFARTCPDRAPYVVGCEITLSPNANDPEVCVAVEEDGTRVFFISGNSCTTGNGATSYLTGGVIYCSSVPPESPLDADSCVMQGREDVEPSFVGDRCDCVVSADLDGCN